MRPARLSDLDNLVLIEERCFNTDRLSRRSLRRFLTASSAKCLLAVVDGRLCTRDVALGEDDLLGDRVGTKGDEPRLARRVALFEWTEDEAYVLRGGDPAEPWLGARDHVGKRFARLQHDANPTHRDVAHAAFRVEARRCEFLEPYLEIVNQAVLPVVHIHCSGDVHCRHEHHAFADAALLDDGSDVVVLGTIHPNPAIQDNRCYTFLARDVAPTCPTCTPRPMSCSSPAAGRSPSGWCRWNLWPVEPSLSGQK